MRTGFHIVVAALGLLVLVAGAAQGEPKYTFAVVPKNLNNPFFDQAQLGCKKAEEELAGEVSCLFLGPGEYGGGTEQVQIVEDLIARKIDGIAVSPSNAAAMAVALEDARRAGIPVVTFDSDLLPERRSLRAAYIGTNNYEIGINLAKLVLKLKPDGGTLCIQSGGQAATNHNERIQAIRDTLSRGRTKEYPDYRLTGEFGWTEVAECPIYTNEDFALAADQIADILAKYPKLDALIQTGGFAELVPDAYRAVLGSYKDKIANGELAIVSGDTLPLQLQAVREGLSSGEVGQRPFEMGYKAMYILKDIRDGKAPPADPNYTGIDICTPQNVDTCVGG
jgi:ribose transport system substrate-binding protein